jgi:enamine deaminase RidA (YjgF/YER057c/UK114 family)
MFKIHNPASVGVPAAAYSHGIEVIPNARWLYISGQVGMSEGRIGRDIEEQSEMAWRNLLAVLASAGMGITDVVKITAFLTSAANVPGYRIIRDRHQAGHRPASTLLVVSALANPEWLVEVEAIAAKG